MEINLAKPLSDKRKQAQVKREQRKQFDPPAHAAAGAPRVHYHASTRNSNVGRGSSQRSNRSAPAAPPSHHFGGFNAPAPPPPPPPQCNPQLQCVGPPNSMGMSNNGFIMNPMQANQSYGGMKRPIHLALASIASFAVGYIVFHHSPYALGPVLACYTSGPATRMAPSYPHPSMFDGPKRIQHELEEKSMHLRRSAPNEPVWLEQ